MLDLRDFGARNQVMADRVHPTAFGQIAIAERALALLAADGLPDPDRPVALIALRDDAGRGRLRGRPHLRVPRGEADYGRRRPR